MALLKFVNEAGQEEIVHVGPDRPEVVIGRNKECELRTRNNTVSRLHAKVVYQDGKYMALDLGSANGTYYKRQKVSEVELEDGETLFCGSLPVEFMLEEEDRQPPVIEPPPAPAAQSRSPLEAKETVSYAADEEFVIEVPEPPPMPVEDEEDVVSFGNEPPPPPPPPPPRVVSPAQGQRPAAPARPPARGTEGFESPVRGEPAQDRDRTVAVQEPVVKVEAASELVRFGGPAPDARQLLQAEKEREAREARVSAREAELEALLAQRDETIRKLGLQVEELNTLVQRLQDAKAEEVKVAELERVLAATEAERESLEESIEALKGQLADAERGLKESERARAELERNAADSERRLSLAEREVSGLKAQLEEGRQARAALDAEVQELRQKLEEASKRAKASEECERLQGELANTRAELERVGREKAALEEEVERWEALKARFEEERSVVQAEVEGLRRQVSEMTAQLTEARAASAKAEETARSLKEMTDELSELKVANRSYLKKISRLLEENERLKAGGGQGGVSEAEVKALKDENTALRAQLEKAQAEARDAIGRAERMAERLAALEAAPPQAGGVDQTAVREAVERVNELVSESRTSLEVISGLLPDLIEKLPDGPEKEDLAEQVKGALAELSQSAREMKAELIKARKAVSQ